MNKYTLWENKRYIKSIYYGYEIEHKVLDHAVELVTTPRTNDLIDVDGVHYRVLQIVVAKDRIDLLVETWQNKEWYYTIAVWVQNKLNWRKRK